MQVLRDNFLDALEERRADAYVAWHSLFNFYYMGAQKRVSPGAKDFIGDLLRFVEVSPTRTRDVLYAIGLAMADSEDALQCAAAVSCDADAIATRKRTRLSPFASSRPQSPSRSQVTRAMKQNEAA